MKTRLVSWLFALAALAFLSSCGNGVDRNEKIIPKPALSDGGSAPERQMAAIIRGHSSQLRKQFVWDRKLAKAARQRAQDLGKRAYFGHIDPDGKGPNWHVTQSGYRLPIKWTAFDTANQVESILAGIDNAERAFNRWLKTPKHLSHVLALSQFYQDQTRFGIGYAQVPNSPFVHYWVLLTAPPES